MNNRFCVANFKEIGQALSENTDFLTMNGINCPKKTNIEISTHLYTSNQFGHAATEK